MFAGGIVRWFVDRATRGKASETDADSGPGVLFSSGLIAGGAIMGVVLAALAAKRWDEKMNYAANVPWLSGSAIIAMIIFVAGICVPLYLVGRKGELAGVDRH
jgi:hypothetical protein